MLVALPLACWFLLATSCGYNLPILVVLPPSGAVRGEELLDFACFTPHLGELFLQFFSEFFLCLLTSVDMLDDDFKKVLQLDVFYFHLGLYFSLELILLDLKWKCYFFMKGCSGLKTDCLVFCKLLGARSFEYYSWSHLLA